MEETVKKMSTRLREIENNIKKLEFKKMVISQEIASLVPVAEKLRNEISSLKTQQASTEDWSGEIYPWSNKIKEILQKVFKFNEFKFKQHSAINAVLSKRDIIVIMPTGGGKSLIYQLPALVTKGITLVVSPLISLITDQINHLTNLGIKAVTINSTNSKVVSKSVYDALSKGTGDIKLIYVTPEWLNKSKRFMSNLQKAYERHALDRIAIDEVHCCSMWGHDFRADYKNLQIFKNIFPDIPIIGVTATATEKVIIECQDLLNISGCLVLKAPYNRPNLFYKVVPKPSTMSESAAYIANSIKMKYSEASGIIYTHSINDSIDLATELCNRGLKAAAYHAQMDQSLRDKIHNKWIERKYQVICATVAFGMGIDKADVRYVIHHSLPKSMENYYQESGRAGRDDKDADCVLMFSIKDIFRVSSLVAANTKNGQKLLYEMVNYCMEPLTCRRALIAVHFDEVWERSQCNNHCDNCQQEIETVQFDIKHFYKDLLKIIKHSKVKHDTNMTPLKLMDAWFQIGPSKKLRLPEVPVPKISRDLGERVLAFLIINDYLKENLHFTLYTTISYIGKGNKEPGDNINFKVALDLVPTPMVWIYHGHMKTGESNGKDKDKKSRSSESNKNENSQTSSKSSSTTASSSQSSSKSSNSASSSSQSSSRSSHTATSSTEKISPFPCSSQTLDHTESKSTKKEAHSTSSEKGKSLLKRYLTSSKSDDSLSSSGSSRASESPSKKTESCKFKMPSPSQPRTSKSPVRSPTSSKLHCFVQSYNAKKSKESPDSSSAIRSSQDEVIFVSSPKQQDLDKSPVSSSLHKSSKRIRFDKAYYYSDSSSSSDSE